MSLNTTVEQRLIGRRRIEDNGCWSYCGRLNDGYGRISIDNRSVAVHRASYELWVGPIPDGMAIDHTCHTNDPSCLGGSQCPHRRCFNPAHLEPVSRGENVLRGVGPTARHAGQTQCKRGHELTPTNTYVLPSGRRQCRICIRARQAKHDAWRRHGVRV